MLPKAGSYGVGGSFPAECGVKKLITNAASFSNHCVVEVRFSNVAGGVEVCIRSSEDKGLTFKIASSRDDGCGRVGSGRVSGGLEKSCCWSDDWLLNLEPKKSVSLCNEC